MTPACGGESWMAPDYHFAIGGHACDSCKRRKVKCNAADPCANCRISGLVCQYTVLPKRRGPKVRRKQSRTGDIVAIAQFPRPQDLEGRFSAEPPSSSLVPQESLISFSDGLELNHQLDSPESPLQLTPIVSSSTPGSTQVAEPSRPAQGIWSDLLVALKDALPSVTAIDVVNCCIDLHMQYIFPTAPTVHEPTLRSHAISFFSADSTADIFSSPAEYERATHMSAFALVTAVCASLSSIMPQSILLYGRMIAPLFLKASREMLKAYETYDLEYPDSASLTIRDLHSVALQHVTGRKGLSDHVLGEACLIALKLRLHNEDAAARCDPIETRVLRHQFWRLYQADMAAASLKSRTYIIHEGLFYDGLTLLPYADIFTPLMDTTSPLYDKSFEEHVLTGFYILPRLWGSAANILSKMRAPDESSRGLNITVPAMTSEYLHFLSLLDSIPPWLQISALLAFPEDSPAALYQKTCFWVQRCTILVTFHCLKLEILQQCMKSGLCEVLGLCNQPLALAVKKTELIQDFLQVIDDIPFIYHQIKGEPNVQRIRHIGTILLEMIHNVDNETIKERAKAYFARILDTLARLESKVSEEWSLQ